MIDFAAAGLGLDYESVTLTPAKEEWADVVAVLAGEIRLAAGDAARDVEHIGSTAVAGMLAKPIVDLAIAVRPDGQLHDLTRPMSALGWIYRGDAGDDGGWVFVLEDRPWHRVAHAHGVGAGSRQWQYYLEFRDLLKSDRSAQRAYEATKLELVQKYSDDSRRYTSGKDAIVKSLLAQPRDDAP